MKFNEAVYRFQESFTAPVDTKRPLKVTPKGKYGTVNPQLNDPHSTSAISGFKGQPGGKSNSLVFAIKKKKKKK